MSDSYPLRVLSAADMRRALPMAEVIAGMKEAFAQLSGGQADVPLRARVGVPEQDGVALFMPAYMRGSQDLAVKIATVFPRNMAQGKPMIYASVLMLDEETGRPLALLEGGTLTAIRTGAGGGAGTDLLARPEARIVAMLGSGVQARAGLEAVCTVRDIAEVRVYSPTRAHAEAFVAEMRQLDIVPDNIFVVDSSSTAVQGADIVYTATTSNTPTFHGRDLKPGAHVTGVGSFTPEMQEVDIDTVQKALVVVDERDAAWAEAGELIIARDQGLITEEHIHAELGELVNGTKPRRTSPEQITFFKSVGVAVQDAVAGRIALQNGEKHDLGIVVPFV